MSDRPTIDTARFSVGGRPIRILDIRDIPDNLVLDQRLCGPIGIYFPPDKEVANPVCPMCDEGVVGCRCNND